MVPQEEAVPAGGLRVDRKLDQAGPIVEVRGADAKSHRQSMSQIRRIAEGVAKDTAGTSCVARAYYDSVR